jgi:hypothetical protein
MNAPVVLFVGLGLPGLLPALAVAGQSLVVLFLAPLIGAGMAAVGATIELGARGSLGADYAVVAVIVNLAVIAWWLRTRRAARPRDVPAQVSRRTWGWSVLTVVVLLGCMALPLSGLQAQMFGWDANSIWLTHALMAYGGHHDLLTGLRNVAYQFSNPDYPPLVPAAGALAFEFFGTGNLHLAPDMTVLLTACALGVLGIGIAATGTGPDAMETGIGGATETAGSGARRAGRIAGIVAAGAICVVAFAVSNPFAIEGYTDLMWAAPAAGAVIWGLVLPPSRQALGVAWICAVAASLTKNEGLTTALVIIVLIALRYRPLSLPGPAARRWAERAAFVVIPALPGLAWAALIKHIGVSDAFFKSGSTETPLYRAQATVDGMWDHLHVLPVALGALLVGWWFLRRDRTRSRLANPAWLWLACLGSLVIIFITYVAGALPIQSWLDNSVNRTTIFAQVVLYAELAVWMVIAVESAFTSRAEQASAQGSSAGERLPEVPDGAAEPVPELDRGRPAQ